MGRRIEDRRIAGSPRRQRPRHGAADGAGDAVNHFAYRMRMPGAEIVDAGPADFDDRLQRLQVRVGEVRHVDVVAQARPVRRGIVVAEHLQRVPAGRRVDGARNQMDLRGMILADVAVGIRAGGVEVAQRHGTNIVGPLEMRKRPLHCQLRVAVAVDGPLRMGFHDRRFDRLAVGGAGRREHEIPHRFRRHRLEHAQRAADIVAVVAHWFAD
jgi:hypothetical protein